MTKGLKPADRSSKPLTNPMRTVNLSVKRHHEVSATLSLFWQKRAKQTRKKCQKWETWTFTKKEGGSSNNNHHYEKKKNNKKNIYERKWRTRRKENIFERLQVFLVKRLKRKEAKKHHRKKRYLKNIYPDFTLTSETDKESVNVVMKSITSWGGTWGSKSHNYTFQMQSHIENNRKNLSIFNDDDEQDSNTFELRVTNNNTTTSWKDDVKQQHYWTLESSSGSFTWWISRQKKLDARRRPKEWLESLSDWAWFLFESDTLFFPRMNG